MQTAPHTWTDVFFQAVTILGSGLLALLGSWVAFRSQRKLKEKELDSQTSFKARELIFDIRRKKYELSNEQAGATMKSLGDLLVKTSLLPDDKKREVILPPLQIIKRALLEIAISSAPVYAEGLQYMYQLCTEERANYVRETMDINLDELLPQDYVGVLLRFAEVFNELEGIRVGLLESVCHETFDEFLPESLKSTHPPKLPVTSQAPNSKNS